jgi:hypothetical protein
MVDPMTMMMLVNAGLSVAQGVQGFAQQKKANEELKKLSRPDYAIPEEAKRALGISQTIASDRNMGLEQAEAEIDANIGNQIANVNRQGGSLADRLTSIAMMTSDANAQKRAGRYQAEQQNIVNLQNYQQSLGQMAQEQRAVQADQLNKYNQQVASLQGMAGAGQQNMAQGLTGLAGSVGQYAGYKGEMAMMDKMQANEMAKLKAMYGDFGNKNTASAIPTMQPKSFSINNPAVGDVNIGQAMNAPVNAPSMLQGATLSNFKPGIGQMIGNPQPSTAPTVNTIKNTVNPFGSNFNAIQAQMMLENNQLNAFNQNRINRFNLGMQRNYGE